MSYLEAPRIVIAGRFISDVSTINNKTGHFDPNTKPSDLGWNPRGGATFDLYRCGVTGAAGAAGSPPASDPVLALAVSGAADRPSGKMVDLDPDWQMSSELWGLTVRLFDPTTGELAFQGAFNVAAFRDLFTRQLEQTIADAVPNQQAGGGRFVSVLRDIEWGPVAARSPLLHELKGATFAQELSVVLNTFGYYYSHDGGRHATGALVGCIGARGAGEPRTFIAGRRLQPLAVPMPAGERPFVLIGPAEAIVAATGRATVDLGHAVLISDVDDSITDISGIGTALAGMRALAFGCLDNENRNTGDRLPAGTATIFGEIDYLGPGWYKRTGGVVSFDITAAQAATAASRPLALFARMQDSTHLVLNRETRDGLYVRADNFVQRLDPGQCANIDLYARRRGLPAGNQTIYVALSAAAANTPPGAIGFANSIVTDADGKASLRLTAANPGSVRPNVDGQIYALAYSARLDADGKPDYTATGLSARFDVVVVHIRSAFDIPQRPEWHRDIQLIMAPYAQLYPVMSRHLFDLNDYKMMAEHRKHLLLAFERPVDDPNYMPVTRDLSDNKRSTIVKWLRNETGNPDEPLVKGVTPPPGIMAAAPVRRTLAPMTRQARAIGEDDIKRAMAQLFAQDTEAVLPVPPRSDG